MADKLNSDSVEMTPRDASTVVLLRDSEQGQAEILLLCRGNSHTVMNNAYVFPGGKVDPDDHTAQALGSLNLSQPAAVLLNEPGLSAERAGALFNAAVRETREETSVVIEASALTPLSRWITPKTPSMMRKRFDARFFVAPMPHGQTAVHDGEEATDSQWLTAHDALLAYQRGDMTLAPPQIMTLIGLLPFNTTEAAIQAAADSLTGTVEPFVEQHGKDRRVLAYPGDPAHPVAERAIPGPSRLVWQDGKFGPEDGFEALLAT